MESRLIQTTLKNQFRTLVVSDKYSPYVFISLIGKVGRRAEKNATVGSAHFLEHLFFDGTSKRPSAYELNKFIEDNGGQKNGLTSHESVQYFVKIIPDKVDVGVEYLSDIFFNSLLNSKDIDKERKIISQESGTNRDNPDKLLYRLRSKTIYPDQPLGQTIFDEEENLQNISQKTLVEYKKRVYNSKNFIIFFGGNIGNQKALSLTKKYFSQFKPGDETIFTPSYVESNQVTHIANKDFKQANLAISFKAFPMYTTKSIIATLVMIVLGRGFSSRLYNKLRNELHLVYHISSITNSFSDSGFTSIETKTSEDKIVQTIEVILTEIKRLLEHGITEDELKKSQNMYNSSLLFNLDGPASLARFHAEQLLYKSRSQDPKYFLRIVNNATTDQLLEVAGEVFSDKPKINIIAKELKSVKPKDLQTS